jgi:uncharacterized protein (TIGR02217 family)
MTIVVNTLPTMPNCPGYGFTARPEFLVTITERTGGYEKRTLRWEEPIYFYDGAPYGPRIASEIQRIWNFYHAMRATHRRFRFKDWMDYKSTTDSMQDAIAGNDQPFVAIDATHFQLVKIYEAENALDMVRKITNPIGSTLIVTNNSGVPQVSSRWTIDENTGILTKGVGFVGTPGGWGGEFYVPARFAAAIQPTIVDREIVSVECSIKSLRSSDT